MMIKKIVFTTALISFLFSSTLFALPENYKKSEPAWVYYEKGKYEMSKKDYGNAIFYFKQALAVAHVLPEAELAIGDAYAAQSDYTLAEQQYLRTLEQKAAFSVPDFYYTCLYRLADLYQKWLKYGKMEATLKTIIKDDSAFNDEKYALFRTKTIELYRRKGFDKMFTYNRLDDTFSTEAHGRLAWYLYKTWNFEAALDNALYSVIPILTESMLEIRREQYNYQYTTLNDFFNTARTIDHVHEYLEERKIYEKLYYLALISYENIPIRRNGIALLQILAATPEADGYQKAAQRQLQNPERESRIDIRKIER